MKSTQSKRPSIATEEPKCPQRNCSQIQITHWWYEDTKKRTFPASQELSLDEQKAALLYEAVRRHPAVRKCWLEGHASHTATARLGWQPFIAKVLDTMRTPWNELCDECIDKGTGQRHATLDRAFFLNEYPHLIPPRGYSFFPEIVKRKGNSALDASHKRAMKAAARTLRVPDSDAQAHVHSCYLKMLRGLQNEGFTILAIDTKTKEARREAIALIQELPQTHRARDITVQLGVKRDSRGRPIGGEEPGKYKLLNPLCLEKIVAKRRRGKGILVDEKLWDFEAICGELTDLDAGKIQKSDFVERIILSA